MGIAWFRGLIVRGRVTKCTAEVGSRVSRDRPQSVPSPFQVRVCAERLSVASPYMSVFCPLGRLFSVCGVSVRSPLVVCGNHVVNLVCEAKTDTAKSAIAADDAM